MPDAPLTTAPHAAAPDASGPTTAPHAAAPDSPATSATASFEADIRAALSPADEGAADEGTADEGTAAYLDLGARLDRASAVQVGRDAVAWWSLHATWDRPWVIAMGSDGREVAACVASLVERLGLPEGLTVARGAFALLPADLRPVEHWEWDWWITRTAPPARPGEDRVIDLAPDDPRIPALLAVASPDAMVRPGDRRILGWAGIKAGSVPGGPGGPATPGASRTDPPADPRALVAVAALTTMRPGVPHLGSVATHQQWRGRGLARDLCSRMTRGALADGAPAVTLGMHAANHTARAVYASLGFRLGYRWASGRFEPAV